LSDFLYNAVALCSIIVNNGWFWSEWKNKQAVIKSGGGLFYVKAETEVKGVVSFERANELLAGFLREAVNKAKESV
jgi:NAD(P)H-dependent FMN reductase